MCALRIGSSALCLLIRSSVRLAFKLVNECRSPTQPLKPLFGSKSIKLSVTIEILRLALCKCALEFLAC